MKTRPGGTDRFGASFLHQALLGLGISRVRRADELPSVLVVQPETLIHGNDKSLAGSRLTHGYTLPFSS